ncbi:MAG TPA: NFACT family protein, partial [Clostridiales bacterium]|nr:NFACT family protein [Clostridiales bacterium]
RAELLTTFTGECPPGASSVTVANYYEENKPVTIALNPALSLRANAKNYYKQYAKAKTASNVLAALIEQGRKELAYLDSVSQALTTAAGPEDLKEIEAEMRREGLLKQSKKTPEKQKTSAVFTEYSAGDGFRILAGRNNTQNDLLTFRTANKHDLWLHARNSPGSHVIVVSAGREIPDDVIGYAAGIAAFFSAAGASNAVDVDYTAVRHVKKPPGAKPGAVLYTDYRTIRVKPINAGPST